MQKLAEFMAEVAEASYDSRNPWRPLSFISTNGSVDYSLEQMGFSDALCAAAQQRKIIPVRSGSLVRPSEARQLDAVAGSWLPPAYFGDVVLAPEKVILKTMLELLDITVLEDDEVRTRLNQASPSLTLPDRAALITGLIKSKLMPSEPAPSLLIDQEEKIIPAQQRVFLPPSESEEVQIPDWVNLRMLHSDLNAELRQRLGVNARGLTTELNAYSLTEFSLTNLSSALVAEANTRVKSEPTRERDYRLETLRAVYNLYSQSGLSIDTMRLSVTTVHLPTATGNFAPANSLYFSGEFACGKICDWLYRPFAPQLVAAPIVEMGLGGEDIACVEKYLRWLGVADSPRLVKKSPSYFGHSSGSLPTEYREFVAERLKYPAKSDYSDFEFKTAAEVKTATIKEVESVDRLEELISAADPYALLAWIALDQRVEVWRRQGDAGAVISRTPPGKQLPRVVKGQHAPSYVLWALEHRAWMPSSNGRLQQPSRCIISAPPVDELKGILPRPVMTHTHPVFQELEIDSLSFQNALQRVGVRLSMEELTLNEVYEILLQLPLLDPSGQSAKSLHRALANRPDDAAVASTPAKSKFMSEGKLWGVLDKIGGYNPVNCLYYVGSNVVPQVIMRRIARLELDKKHGAAKIQRVFGVQTLDVSKWQVKVNTFALSNASERFRQDIEYLKPYIYALRLYSDTTPAGLLKLKHLQVHLCNRVEGVAIVDGASETFNLEEHGEVVLDDASVFLFTNALPTVAPLQDVVLVDAVSEIFSEILGVERGSDFARLMSAPLPQRLSLLARVLGVTVTDAESWLQQAREKLDTPIVEVPDAGTFAPWVASPPNASSTLNFPVDNPALPADAPSTSSTTAVDANHRTGPIQFVSVEQKEHFPSPPSRKIQLRIQATPATTTLPRPQTRVTDAARCQEVILHFEAAQGRFALPVSQLQGELAYGCDVLSFDSPQLLEQFIEASENPDTTSVSRFIEVKGKSSESSTIELRGNELRAAEVFRQRYYLYRVYEEVAGEFSILTLADPLSADCKHIYEVNLSQQETTERYRATEEWKKPVG